MGNNQYTDAEMALFHDWLHKTGYVAQACADLMDWGFNNSSESRTSAWMEWKKLWEVSRKK